MLLPSGLLIVNLVVANAQSNHSNLAQNQNTVNIPTVEFCELVRQTSKYKGKEVRVRALYHSWFEGWEFTKLDGHYCNGAGAVWVDFGESFESRTAPALLKKLEDSSYRPQVDENGKFVGEYWDWQVELLVTGVIYKPNKKDYGRKNSYSRIFVVTSVAEVGALKAYDHLTQKYVEPKAMPDNSFNRTRR
jgi:hypothetical protein